MSLSPPSMTAFFWKHVVCHFFPPCVRTWDTATVMFSFLFPSVFFVQPHRGPLLLSPCNHFTSTSPVGFTVPSSQHTAAWNAPSSIEFNSGALYTEIMMILSQVQARLPRPIQYVLTEFGQRIFNMRYTVQVHHKNRSSDWIAAEWLFVNLFNFWKTELH